MNPLGKFFGSRIGMYTLGGMFLFVLGIGLGMAVLAPHNDKPSSFAVVQSSASTNDAPVKGSPTENPETTNQATASSATGEQPRVSIVDVSSANDEVVPAPPTTRSSYQTSRRIAYRQSTTHSNRRIQFPGIDGLPGAGEFGTHSAPAHSKSGPQYVEEWYGSKKRVLAVPASITPAQVDE